MIAGSTSWASSSELAPSCPILANADAHCLVAAAYLHDIGWAPELVDTGFHSIGRARWVQRHGFERLARLVAHHSAARFEAELRGLAPLLAAFELEESPTADPPFASRSSYPTPSGWRISTQQQRFRTNYPAQNHHPSESGCS